MVQEQLQRNKWRRCVEVAIAPGAVRSRDSKAQAEAVLAFPRQQ
ncbi:DUF397 domain-containing protein [Streptomyces sp. PU_AKi4]